jgi:thymidylate synthase (FAD)
MLELVNVLDSGFVRVVDKMGSDNAIVQAARISYGHGTKHTSEDRALIRYLMRHNHITPFEMCEIKLHIKMPMFVARQWFRHRTANINEYSARYSLVEDEFYIPAKKDIALQSVNNKQGRGETVLENQADEIINLLKEQSTLAYQAYKKMLDQGVARELARIILPQNMYTQFYWKCDLRNVMHLILLRSHHTAQFEIREYSNAIEEIIKEWVPYTHEAFVDYLKHSYIATKVTRKFLKRANINQEELEKALGKTELAEFEKNWPNSVL